MRIYNQLTSMLTLLQIEFRKGEKLIEQRRIIFEAQVEKMEVQRLEEANRKEEADIKEEVDRKEEVKRKQLLYLWDLEEAVEAKRKEKIKRKEEVKRNNEITAKRLMLYDLNCYIKNIQV